MKNSMQMNGSAKVEVVDHNGRVVRSIEQPNLILDAGMERLATVVMADLFTSCARGTGTTDTKEIVSGATTYQQTGNTVTCTGSRNFAAGDVGKVIKFSNGMVARIQSQATSESQATSTASVDVSQTVPALSTAIIYAVDQEGLDNETHRTSLYSAAAGDNGTTDVDNLRTMKRTFVFYPESDDPDVVLDNYSKVSNVVARLAGSSRDFTIDDEGSYLRFPSEGVEYLITSFIDADSVEVDDSAFAIASGPITIYGFNEYNEIGFSHTASAGNNLNSRIKLASPVAVRKPTGVLPGQQMRVTYSLAVTVSPATANFGTAPITDPANVMSSDKSGSYGVESLALSSVNADGTTNYTNMALEPSVGGYIGLSNSFSAVSPFAGTSRGSGLGYIQAVNLDYTPLSFSRTTTASFGINDAIGSAKRSILLFSDPAAPVAAFVFVFSANQRKTHTSALNLQFKKTWSRTLN